MDSHRSIHFDPHTEPNRTLIIGPTRIIHFDLHEELEVDYAATSPNLLAAYVRIAKGEKIETQARATSQVGFPSVRQPLFLVFVAVLGKST